jgi:hypothetical protein
MFRKLPTSGIKSRCLMGSPSNTGSQPTMPTAHWCITADLDGRCPLYPESGHWFYVSGCPLCAKSSREQVQQNLLLKATYSMTLSASTKAEAGISKPIDFAVFMLTINSKLVGCCTGTL